MIVGVALIILVVCASGFETYDYSLRCTKCLREYQAVEYQFFGITYRKIERPGFAGHDLTDVLGAPCQHVYRIGGFGRESGWPLGRVMGDYGAPEGGLFRPRWGVLAAAFSLYERFPNKELLRRTFRITDSILPADATIDYLKGPNHNHLDILFMLDTDLNQAKSEQDWEQAVKKAEMP